MVLSLTGKCNFACKYCYASGHDQSDMNVAVALQAVEMAAASGENFVIQFSGGEPLLNFECLKTVVDYVHAKKIPARLQLQTNAALLTDMSAKYLYRNKVAIGVSLDGRPAVNDKLRLTGSGEGASDKIISGINVLRRNKIACGITCVVTSENVDELAGIVELAYFLGNVRRIGFDLLRGQGRGAQLHPPDAEKTRLAMERVHEHNNMLSRFAGYKIALSQHERVRALLGNTGYEFGHCYAMNGEAAFVDAGGDIYACSSLMGDPEFYTGNVEKGLQADLVQKIQQRIRSSMNFCKECADFKLCGGGCFARWYGSGGKYAYESECALKRASIAQVIKN